MKIPRFIRNLYTPVVTPSPECLKKDVPPEVIQREQELEGKLDEATREHRKASVNVRRATFKQVQDNMHVREALKGVLDSIENRQGNGNG